MLLSGVYYVVPGLVLNTRAYLWQGMYNLWFIPIHIQYNTHTLCAIQRDVGAVCCCFPISFNGQILNRPLTSVIGGKSTCMKINYRYLLAYIAYIQIANSSYWMMRLQVRCSLYTPTIWCTSAVILLTHQPLEIHTPRGICNQISATPIVCPSCTPATVTFRPLVGCVCFALFQRLLLWAFCKSVCVHLSAPDCRKKW